MSFSTANRTQVALVKETVKGETPATPVFVTTNYTGEDLNSNVETVTSETIRADRQTSDLVRVSVDVSGGIDAEIRAIEYEDLIESALQGTWSTPLAFSGSSIDVVASTFTVTTGAAAFADAVPGQWIKISGMVEEGNNGWHQIDSITSATEAILTAASDSLVDESQPAGGEIGGKSLTNGVLTSSYTIEKLFNDTTVPTYFDFRGCEVSTMEMNFETGSILTANFGFIGRSGESSETMIAGATYQPASTSAIMDAVNSLSTIIEDGGISNSSFQSMTLSLDNNSRGQEAIGTLGYVGVAHGSVLITGTTSIYFEDVATFQKYRDGLPFSLSFILESPDGDMVVTLPRAKFSNITINATGINTDVLADAEFTAIIDPVTGVMIRIDVA